MTVRKIILATLFASGMTGVAFSQDVIFAPDDEVVVREYVVKQPRTEVVIPDGYEVEIGEALPDTITVTPLDAPGFEKKFEYVVIDGRTVLIDPDTRRVVKVLE